MAYVLKRQQLSSGRSAIDRIKPSQTSPAPTRKIAGYVHTEAGTVVQDMISMQARLRCNLA